MPNWTHRPPADVAGKSIRLRRTPAAGKLLALVTADDLIGTQTHFAGNRTQPCQGSGCDCCAEGVPWRYHAYLTAVDIDTAEHFIFELTAQACEAFVAHKDTHGTLRGALFQARRPNGKPNGRVEIKVKPGDLRGRVLPPEPNTIALLSQLWNIPYPELKPANQTKRHPRLIHDPTVPKGGNNNPLPQNHGA
jgi:hypothetical protein